MATETNKLVRGLRAGQTIYLVMMLPSACIAQDWAQYSVRSLRVLSDKAASPVPGELVEAAPRSWIEARVPAAAVYCSRRQAERFRKAFQAKADRRLGSDRRDG